MVIENLISTCSHILCKVLLQLHDYVLFSDNNRTWPRGYKTFSMLNSVKLEILNAHNYKNIKKFGFY